MPDARAIDFHGGSDYGSGSRQEDEMKLLVIKLVTVCFVLVFDLGVVLALAVSSQRDVSPQAGRKGISINVTKAWVNRLIGDGALPHMSSASDSQPAITREAAARTSWHKSAIASPAPGLISLIAGEFQSCADNLIGCIKSVSVNVSESRRPLVHDLVLNSGWQTALVAVPSIILLLAGVFRLDQVFVSRTGNPRRKRPTSEIDEYGQPVLYDPDGRPSRPVRIRR
jgi:hypothetical protein